MTDEITDTFQACEITLEGTDCSFGVSRGAHTRCYVTQEHKDNWRTAPYCSSGGIKVFDAEELNVISYIPNKIIRHNGWYTQMGDTCYLHRDLKNEKTGLLLVSKTRLKKW